MTTLTGIVAVYADAGWCHGGPEPGFSIVARFAGEVVGVIRLVDFDPPDVLVGGIAVLAARRGRGIGTDLMREAMAVKAGTWWLECRHERIAFYERLGFAVVAESVVPVGMRTWIGLNAARPQYFMSRTVAPD